MILHVVELLSCTFHSACPAIITVWCTFMVPPSTKLFYLHHAGCWPCSALEFSLVPRHCTHSPFGSFAHFCLCPPAPSSLFYPRLTLLPQLFCTAARQTCAQGPWPGRAQTKQITAQVTYQSVQAFKWMFAIVGFYSGVFTQPLRFMTFLRDQCLWDFT